MIIKLAWIKIRHFKGISSFDQRFDGRNATVTAQNGTGKTSVYDAELWLFFGKDSTGRSDFGIVPLDRFNDPIKGLTTTVEAGYLIDGAEHVFKKEQVEKRNKGGDVVGYACNYWINEVPKLLKEYKVYIEAIITEERFKLLTNLAYFNELHHTEQRKILKEVTAEDITIPEGYDDLKAELKGRTLKEFRDILRERKAKDKKELDGINPRIDEIMLGIEHPDFDVKEQEDLRSEVESDILKIKTNRTAVRGKETERQGHINEVNRLTMLRTKRETALASDTSAIEDLLTEKKELLEKAQKAEASVIEKKSVLQAIEGLKSQSGIDQSVALAKINNLRDELKGYEGKDIKTICSECKQNYPDGMLKECKQRRADKIFALKKQTAAEMKKIESSEQVIEELNAKIRVAKREHDEALAFADKFTESMEKSFAEITEEIKASPTPDPKKDESWLQITKDIKKAEGLIGEPVTEQLNTLDAEQEAKQKELDKINQGLAQADRIAKDKLRIQELKAKEGQLAQAIADVDKLLNDIELYRKGESLMITKSVNSKFKHTKFKMFQKNLGDDGIRECCEATYKGTPYGGMSFGERIFVGLDIIWVLSGFYDCAAPLFIDHAESMTLPIETECQTIKLVAKVGVKELEVSIG